MSRRIRGRTAKEGESGRMAVRGAEMNTHKRCRDSDEAMKVTTGDVRDTATAEERQDENPICSQQALFPTVKRARYVPVLQRQARRKGKRSGVCTEQGTNEEAGHIAEENSCEKANIENITLDDEDIPKSKITVNKKNDSWPLPGIAENASLNQENIQLDLGMEEQKAMGKYSTEIGDASFNTMSTKVTSEGGVFEITEGASRKPFEAIEVGNEQEKQDNGQNQKKETVSKVQTDQAEPLVKQSSVLQREGCDEFDVEIENSKSPGPTTSSLQMHVDDGVSVLGTESLKGADTVIEKPKCNDSLIGKTEAEIVTDVFSSSPNIFTGSAENSKIIPGEMLNDHRRFSANELSVFQTIPVSFECCLKSSQESQGLENDMLHSAEVACSDGSKSPAKKPGVTDYRDSRVGSAHCDVIGIDDIVTNPVFITNSDRKLTDGNYTNGSNTGLVECKDAASDAIIETEDCATDNVELAAPAVDFQRVDDNGLKICADMRDAMYPQGGDRKVLEQNEMVDLKGKPAFNYSDTIEQKGEKTERETMTLKDKTQSTVSITEQSARATTFQGIIATTEAESTRCQTVDKRTLTSMANEVKEKVRLESSEMVSNEISAKYLGDETQGQDLIAAQNIGSRRSKDSHTEIVSSRVRDIVEGDKDEKLCDEATKGCCVGSSTNMAQSQLSSNFQEDFDGVIKPLSTRTPHRLSEH
uniref:uncharacterized protein isoform X2 n=1 Tax=Myxine glutinosa TaxID=7769 RepID=UPI00358FFE7E